MVKISSDDTNNANIVSEARVQLKLVGGNEKLSGGFEAIIHAFNVMTDTDLVHNPVLRNSYHFDVILSKKKLHKLSMFITCAQTAVYQSSLDISEKICASLRCLKLTLCMAVKRNNMFSVNIV
jgi:hypothetical protein